MATPRTVFNLDDPQVEFNRTPEPKGVEEDRLQQVQTILKQYSRESENKPTPPQQRVWSTAQKPASSETINPEITRRIEGLERNVQQLSDIVSLLVELRTR